MRVLVATLFAISLTATGRACAQEATLRPTVEFRALNREQPEDGATALAFWSFYDHSDSVEVVVGLPAPAPASASGAILTEVSVGVARIIWESEAKEVPDYEATVERAYWLPAVVTSTLHVGDLQRSSAVVATVRPDELFEQLRGSDPEVLLTALLVRSCYVGNKGVSDGVANCAEKEIPLYMAH